MIQARFQARDVPQFTLPINSEDTVWQIRQRLTASLGIAVERLKFRKQILSDNQYIKDLGLSDKSVIFVNPQVYNQDEMQCHQRFQRPRTVGWTEKQVSARVNRLVEFGFPRDDCERALKAAWFNMNRAVNYLISGFIPEPLRIRENDSL
jgi:uncharacterized UBP type Zn finger protein